MALMVYSGGIYPVPQTAFLLVVYALVLAIVTRRWRPIGNVLAVGAIGAGLSAPKLLPILESLSRYPRLVLSTESIDLTTFLTILTSHDQSVGSRPADIHQWGWHEYGMFVGWAAFVALACGALFARGQRATALRWTACLLLLLGFGNFHEYSPWNQLHNFPVFRSQHVPMRWLYVAALVFALLAAGLAEGILRRAALVRARPVGELAALAFAAYVAIDIGRVANLPMQSAFGMNPPAVRQELSAFHVEKTVPASLRYTAGDYAPPALPSEIANVGTIECITFPGLNVYARDGAGHAPGLGARGKGDASYKGEAFTVGGGRADILEWTPNSVTVAVSGAVPGDVVVLNQNYDPGWTVNGASALNHEDTVAAPISQASQVFVFRYRPRPLGLSLFVFALTVGGIAAAFRLRRLWLKRVPASHPARANASVTFVESPPC
jgi:hypothetical protein